MKQTDPQLKFRVTPELKQRLQAAADAARRPLSSEIVDRLERSLLEEEAAGDARSQLAAERILRADLSGKPDPVLEGINDLRNELLKIKERLSRVERRS